MPDVDLDGNVFTTYHWDWKCDRCGNIGSVPVDDSVMMMDAVRKVQAHHADVYTRRKQICDRLSINVKIIAVVPYS